MSDTERQYLVTWKRSSAIGPVPDNGNITKMLGVWLGGTWDVVQRLIPDAEHDVTRKQYDGLLNDCLKHIPPAFWRGDSREETILTYLSAVDDAMELISENIAARITKEVR